MATEGALGLIAGNGIYPRLLADAARRRGVPAVHVAAFDGETDPGIGEVAATLEWLKVGQLARLLKFFQERGVRRAVMAGQISPKHLFDLRPDMKALLLLARLPERNAASLFGAIADELARTGIHLLPAYTYLEEALAGAGHLAGPAPKRRLLEDARYGFRLAKEVSRLDIGQTVVVRHGTVLAVEAFEGTDDAIRRGAALGRRAAVVAKVSKPDQDMRFDVPVIGVRTLDVARSAGVRLIAVETGRTLLLDADAVRASAERLGVTLYGLE